MERRPAGSAALAALWLAWSGYAWLTSTIDVDEGGVRLTMLASTAAMLGVALAVPGAFEDDALLFGLAYLVVRILHLLLYAMAARDDPRLDGGLLRLVPTELLGALLFVGAAFVEDDARVVVGLAALAIDYGGPLIRDLEGWRIAPEHFAERHGLIVLIALGESVISIGLGASLDLVPKVLAAAALGLVVISALWWLYFDVAAIFARRRLEAAVGVAQARLAVVGYTVAHLPMIAGIVLFAFGLEEALHHVDAELDAVHAVALCGGVGLYLLAQVGFLVRMTGRVFRRPVDRRGCVVRADPCRARDPRARRAPARRRRLRVRRRVRGDPPPRAPAHRQTPRAGRLKIATQT